MGEDTKEERIRKITQLYYSNPKIQEIMLKFASGREIVPKYFEAFGKRPDILSYNSDIISLVKRGATSFHASEEIWADPLKLHSELSADEMNKLRKSWDLVIDIDSKYLDYSKIATGLMIKALEEFGIKEFGIKFSGSKGFHIIVHGDSFPREFAGFAFSEMFPEWPRIICEFLINKIRIEYNKRVSEEEINFEAIKERSNLTKEELEEVLCSECRRVCKKGKIVEFLCPECKTRVKRKDFKLTKKKLSCINERCVGKFDVVNEEDYFYCEHCETNSINKREESESKNIVYSSEIKKEKGYSSSFVEGISGNALAGLDMVLVAPRHLFRMPYSLHEKTSLASVVMNKTDIEKFDPIKDADPLKINIKEFIPKSVSDGRRLLISALDWKKGQDISDQKFEKKVYSGKEIDIHGVSEDLFPRPIKKLLNGLVEGRKRGLFVLLSFLKSLNFSHEYINQKVREWNKLNKPPLKEGYVKGQIEWHLKQRKKILPPNYSNSAFYKDIGILERMPDAKNPIVEVIREIKRKEN